MRGVYKKEPFPDIHDGPRYQVENTTTTRLQRWKLRVETRPAWVYGSREPKKIEGQEGESDNWEGYKIVDWS